MTKKCSKCLLNKPLSEFRVFSRSSDGLAAWCIACHKDASKAHYLANKESRNKASEKWRAANPEKVRTINAKTATKHKEKRAIAHKEWRCRNRDKVRAIAAKRKAARLRATPAWVDQAAIEKIYSEAIAIERNTGIAMHVDHVVPLQSDLVCGLHVPANLRVIPAKENISKRNFYWPDMPDPRRAYAQGKLFAVEVAAQPQQTEIAA